MKFITIIGLAMTALLSIYVAWEINKAFVVTPDLQSIWNFPEPVVPNIKEKVLIAKSKLVIPSISLILTTNFALILFYMQNYKAKHTFATEEVYKKTN